MNFSYSAVWDETVKLARSHLPLVLAVAGVFIFLPNLMVAHFLPPPQGDEPNMAGMLAAMSDYFSANWPWLLLGVVVNMAGTIAILLLVFDRNLTVGGAIAGGLALLPFYFLASLLSGVILFAGFLAFIVPALYLYGRLAPLAAVVVAERQRNPIEAVRRSFELTRGRGWSLFLLIILVWAAASLVTFAISAVVGSLFLLLLGEGLGRFLVLIVSTALATAVTALLILLIAAIYQQLAGSDASASQ